jgi:CMP-N-acetylneuraminic acid synthetase
MIPAVVIGRGGSKGFPMKNEYLLDGRPMLVYPLLAAMQAGYPAFLSTEDSRLASIAKSCLMFQEPGVEIIWRPPELATDEALGEDVFVHAYREIKRRYSKETVEAVILMFANAPCITPEMIKDMVSILLDHRLADSICTVSKYNMFSPYRARKIESGWLRPFSDTLIWEEGVTCDRDSGTDCWIYDCSCAVVEPYCLELPFQGKPPQRWLGRNILPYRQKLPALDVDYEWQIPQVEVWLEYQKRKIQ